MEPNEERPSKDSHSKDTVFIRFTAEMLPPDSPEFQERAKLPRSKRGPNLALYHELRDEQKAETKNEEPPAQ